MRPATWPVGSMGRKTITTSRVFSLFFFNDTATTEIYTLSLHDALPICVRRRLRFLRARSAGRSAPPHRDATGSGQRAPRRGCDRAAHHRHHRTALHRRRCQERSEEHTSELQSLAYLVCRLLLEKKKKLK